MAIRVDTGGQQRDLFGRQSSQGFSLRRERASVDDVMWSCKRMELLSSGKLRSAKLDETFRYSVLKSVRSVSSSVATGSISRDPY